MKNKSPENIARICLGGGLVLLAFIVASLLAADSPVTKAAAGPSAVETIPRPAAVDSASLPHQLGSMSCSSTACHGSVQPDRGGPNHNGDLQAPRWRILRTEFLYWLENDPHAGAGAVLYNAQSRRILRNLGALQTSGGREVTTGSYRNTIKGCADCHNPTAAATLERESFQPGGPHDFTSIVGRAVGVDCESCHGPARRWLKPHYRPAWNRFTPQEKESYGMYDTQNLLSRAHKCAECHVGKAGMDVNHDLIAAGHPPLKFEYSAYLDALPKHWDHARERQNMPDYELRTWVAGQLATAQAALRLLAARADASDPAWQRYQPVYPEFAEYDCFACHHDLQSPSWRIQQGFAGRTPGSLTWGGWYFTMLRRLSGPPSAQAIDTLTRTMTNHPVPARKTVRDDAARALAALQRWAEEKNIDAWLNDPDYQARPQMDMGQTLSSFFVERDGTATVDSWDSAVQAYLFLVALHTEQSNRAALGELRQVRAALRYESGYDSPRHFAVDADTAASVPADIRKKLLHIYQMLNN